MAEHGGSQARWCTVTAGVLSVALFIAAAACLYDAPEVGAGASVVTDWLSRHRTRALIGVYVEALCILATVTFLSALASCVVVCEQRHRLGSTLTRAAELSGWSIFIVAGVTMALYGTAAFLSDHEAPASLRDDLAHPIYALYAAGAVSVNITGAFTGLSNLLLAIACIRASALPLWLSIASIVVAALHFVSAAAFARSGPMSPSGIGVWLCPPLYYAWIAAVCVVVALPRRCGVVHHVPPSVLDQGSPFFNTTASKHSASVQ
eukprot:TRINITY_DN8082_c0_g1_i1.p1 TRINITY_DN8082_c0_g1~~TRINITY_DN8082_c0_g1_i1.p1  ORF type:complete len:263 (+),score=89.42 TRINITY_DN8082_c0_g1_i1:101-889(+)